ncbi:hypothetical protein HPC49_51160 [Pyxidicoccus fallax]|uniref:Hydrogenase maturation nickel metallochaperone HypA n=1 Tax=Pyxidicoccus fallax TaxID=394095 RepID=A0A848M0X8_9BACT|nr:hypothetical protein [Pyxidicoccus fallax]NMO23173.1 hydrogenase maturation nickel metallochaperone HypA [Pyxidicoccus fallax]NPC86535.1 hypothetical protein [Pyxidicoccus fallax]
MAKRTRIIEGTWNCTSCDTQGIPARHKVCPHCGNPRELTGKESEFDFGGVDAKSGKSLREGVTDSAALELAAAGEDWFCAYCGAANRGDSPRCKQCSAERTDDAKASVGRELPSPAQARPVAAPKKPLGKKAWLALGLLFSCCFGSALFSLWAGSTHEFAGSVTGTAWKRSVVRERFSPVVKTGWRDELSTTPPRMPVNGAGEAAGVANVRDCASRQRGTRRVPDGTERVCRTKTRKVACGTEEKCRRRDQGNGFVEEVCEDVTKYCSESYEDCQTETRYRTEPVFAQQCRYDTYEWKEQDRRELSGTDDRPRWPELPASGVDRLRREETYSVRVRYEDDGEKEHVLEPGSEQEFLTWKKGQGVSLTVTNLGKVEKVVPR